MGADGMMKSLALIMTMRRVEVTSGRMLWLNRRVPTVTVVLITPMTAREREQEIRDAIAPGD